MNPGYYVYIVELKDKVEKDYYIGYTSNITGTVYRYFFDSDPMGKPVDVIKYGVEDVCYIEYFDRDEDAARKARDGLKKDPPKLGEISWTPLLEDLARAVYKRKNSGGTFKCMEDKPGWEHKKKLVIVSQNEECISCFTKLRRRLSFAKENIFGGKDKQVQNYWVKHITFDNCPDCTTEDLAAICEFCMNNYKLWNSRLSYNMYNYIKGKKERGLQPNHYAPQKAWLRK